LVAEHNESSLAEAGEASLQTFQDGEFCKPWMKQWIYVRPSAAANISDGIHMNIKRNGSQPSGKGPAEYFTGTVRIDPLFQAPDPASVVGASVTFEPGAGTAWHTQSLGQTLIVTAGCSLAQRWGGPIEEIRPGDVVWFAPGEKHWHGAKATTA
jgi:quercetin dioxygenase-like cupin family protein